MTGLKESQLLPIKELLNNGLSFFIPDYQRGYRWTVTQVEDLLNDVLEFHKRKYGIEDYEKYILQPIVVDTNKEPISVIDGQQRLTTIFLILNYLRISGLYKITYQSRPKSNEYLQKNISESLSEKNDNIDYFYMYGVKAAIEDWFEKNVSGSSFRKRYIETLLNKVHVVWEPIDPKENHIDVFTRINGGRIPLTDSELIKALFLDKSKYLDDEVLAEAHQLEIASCWERIENTLQNDEFWLFICNKSYFDGVEDGSTRIDYFLNIITDNNSLELDSASYQAFDKNVEEGREGKYYRDEHKIFRYFEKKFENVKDSRSLMACWNKIKEIYQILTEWYHDCKLFHYIGYLILVNEEKAINEIGELLNQYQKKEKTAFVDYVHKRISELIANKKWLFDDNKEFNWNYEYEETTNDNGDIKKQKNKRECVDILLLHNIETIVRQNDYLVRDKRYHLPNFTRFELHLYKKNSWEVEHIRPNAGDKFDTINDKQLYIKTALPYLKNYSEYRRIMNDANIVDKKFELEKKVNSLYASIYEYLKKNPDKKINKSDDNEFNVIRDAIDKEIEEGFSQLGDEEKNKIWNYTLLDKIDNTEYGNKIYPVKRLFLSYKEQGVKIKVNDLAEYMLGVVSMDDLRTNGKTEPAISFIPPITKNVFAKTFTECPRNMTSWTLEDAKAYLANMKCILHDFIKEAETIV